MKSTFAVIVFFTFLFITSSTLLAQKDSANLKSKNNLAQLAADKLQQKLLLSEKQTQQVEVIISKFLKEKTKSDDEVKSVQEKIENLLDNRQKAKFEIVKSDWWGFLTKHINEK